MMRSRSGFTLLAVLAMAIVVIASNIAVNYPINFKVGGVQLADLLTYGALTYPVAFLVTDLTNRHFGASSARRVVFFGFLLAVILSIWLATPRIAIASGTAFLVAQLLDISIFDRLRNGSWWKAPVLSSMAGSIIDTGLFFSLAFAASFSILGPNDAFAIDLAPLFGVLELEAPRWVSWALGDLAVKVLVALLLLIPYRLVSRLWRSATDVQ